MTGNDDPLRSLLRLLADGQGHTVAALARSLDVDADLVTQMISTLEGAGYVQRLELGCCSQPCDKCPSGATCGMIMGSRVWSVTPRGARALALR